MELDELKGLWKAEDKNLDSGIKLNAKHLMEMNMENATGDIEKIIRISLVGRNIALVYCFISTAMAIFYLEAIEYSIPAVLGGLAMLYSFISHLSIEKLDYKDSIVQLQKKICTFRAHAAANAKYDMLIVAFWFITIMPLFLKIVSDISLYKDNKALAIFCLVATIVLTLMTALSRKRYTEYDRCLAKSETHLSELIEFETDNQP